MKRLLIGCMELLFLILAYHYFWPGLIALPKEHPTLPIELYIYCVDNKLQGIIDELH
jgi:hypothetical protein